MRLIDADAFDRDLCNHKFTAALNEAADAGTAFEDKEMYYSTQSFRDVMKYRPTIDAVPVVHGRWIITSGMKPPEYHHMHQCSVCETYALRLPPYGNREALSPWCPACGAKMDMKEEQDADKT